MSQVLGVILSQADTVPQFGLGEEYVSPQGSTFKYCSANGAIAQYRLSTIDEDHDAVIGTTTTAGAKPQLCGITMASLADNQYGWFAVGPFSEEDLVYVLGKTLCVHDVKLYTHATAGSVDDTATTQIVGLALSTTVGGADANTLCYAVDRLTVNA